MGKGKHIVYTKRPKDSEVQVCLQDTFRLYGQSINLLTGVSLYVSKPDVIRAILRAHKYNHIKQYEYRRSEDIIHQQYSLKLLYKSKLYFIGLESATVESMKVKGELAFMEEDSQWVLSDA